MVLVLGEGSPLRTQFSISHLWIRKTAAERVTEEQSVFWVCYGTLLMFLLTLLLGDWHLLLSAEKDLAFCYHLRNKEKCHSRVWIPRAWGECEKNTKRENDTWQMLPQKFLWQDMISRALQQRCWWYSWVGLERCWLGHEKVGMLANPEVILKLWAAALRTQWALILALLGYSTFWLYEWVQFTDQDSPNLLARL